LDSPHTRPDDSPPIADSELDSNAVPVVSHGPTQADLMQSAVSPRPRVWPISVVLVLSLACYIVASILALVVAAFAVEGRLAASMLRDPAFIQSLTQSTVGFPLIVVIPQVAMVIPAILAAWLSPIRMGERLNLVRGRWPLVMWISAACATPLIGMISSAVVGSFMEDSATLVEMTRVFRDFAGAGYMIPLALLVGATPGVCEELLFRGYIQTRLTQRYRGGIGILLTSILFAVFHMDLVHSTAVFALGVWLGWICWHSGSLFPAMLAHFVNNTISVVAVSIGPEPDANEVSLGVAAAMLGVFFIGSGALLVTLVAAWQIRSSVTTNGDLVSRSIAMDRNEDIA
jgi:uncharacterized protein